MGLKKIMFGFSSHLGGIEDDPQKLVMGLSIKDGDNIHEYHCT